LTPPFHCRDAEEAEAIAILEGIRFVDRWPNETHVVLKTDCSSLASKLNGGVMDRAVTSGTGHQGSYGKTVVLLNSED
jgi:hypothetical protein